MPFNSSNHAADSLETDFAGPTDPVDEEDLNVGLVKE